VLEFRCVNASDSDLVLLVAVILDSVGVAVMNADYFAGKLLGVCRTCHQPEK
jgi:hypothetical protein